MRSVLRNVLGVVAVCALLTGGAAFAEEGLYVLDSYGGLHSAGTVSGMPPGPYFERSGVRDFVLAAGGLGYYVLTGEGQVFPVGDAPELEYRFFGWDIARQLILAPQGHYVLDGFGILHAFQGAPELPGTILQEPVAQAFALSPDGRGGYVLDRFGGIHAVGDAEPVVGPYFGWDIARDLVVNEDGSFYVLDGYGGIHCEGSVFLSGPYFNVDSAKRFEVLPSGDGAIVLDGQGGVHPVGNAPGLMANFNLRAGSAVAMQLRSSGNRLGAIQGKVDADAPSAGGGSEMLPPGIMEGLIARLEGTDFATPVAPDGFFQFRGVPEGLYALIIENPENPDLRLRLAQIRVRRGITWDLGLIRLRQTGRILGTVLLEGADYHMGTDVYLAGLRLLAKTDRDGSFRMFFVPEGSYTVVMERPGFVSVEVSDVHVTAGEDTDLGTITLRRSDALLGAVEGVVYRKASAEDTTSSVRLIPVAGAEVAMHRVNSAAAVFDRPLRVRTNEDGSYLIKDVPQGVYLIRAKKLGVGLAQARLSVESEETIQQDLILEMPPAIGGKLVGTIVEDTGNLDLWVPIPGAKVTVLLPDGRSKNAFTDRLGGYEIGEIPPGFHRVVAEKPGFEPQRQAVQIRSFQETEANFRLRKIVESVGALRGTVYKVQFDSNASAIRVPLSGSLVTLFPTGRYSEKVLEAEENIPISRFSAWTDEQGQYAIRNIPAGEYVAVAFHRGYLPQRAVVSIVAEVVVEQDFVLLPKEETEKGSVVGMVREDVGNLLIVIPIPEATVAMLNLDGRERYATRTDEQGRFAFPEISAGRYIGRAIKEGYLPQSQPVSVLSGEETWALFELKKDIPIRPGEVFGSVVAISQTEEGQSVEEPIADARVILLPCGIPWSRHCGGLVRPGVPPLETRTDAQGNYRFPEVQPGSYRVCVEAEGFPRAVKPATVLPEQQVEVNFQLPKSVVPTFGSLNGIVTNAESGDPVAGAELAVWKANVGIIARTLSGEDGSFDFPRLPAGDYVLKANARGYAGFHAPVTIFADQAVTVSVALSPIIAPPTATPKPDPTKTPIPEPTRTPLPTPTPLPEQGSISGVVQTRSAADVVVPVQDAVVKLIRPETSNWVRSQRTNSRGEYSFDNVPGGVYVLKVFKEGFLVPERRVTLEPGASLEVNFVLEPIPSAGAVFGTVFEQIRDGSFKAPIAGATVTLNFAIGILSISPDMPRIAVTNEYGRYFFGEVPDGNYLVSVRKDGYEAQSRNVSILNRSKAQIDFVLRRVQTEPTPTPTPFFVTAIGRVVPKPQIDGNTSPVTHTLLSLDTSVPLFQLQSATINLVQYEQKACSITGRIVAAPIWGPPVMEVTAITALTR